MGESVKKKNYDEEIESVERPTEKSGEDSMARGTAAAGLYRFRHRTTRLRFFCD
jgi:hypothetical protein